MRGSATDRPVTGQADHRRAGRRGPGARGAGPYSEKELVFQAEDVASGLTFNASFDCNANRVVVLPTRLGPARAVPRLCCAQALEQRGRSAGLLPWRAGALGALPGGHAAIRASAARPRAALPWTLVPGLDAGARGRAAVPRGVVRADHRARPRSAAPIRPSSSSAAVTLRQRPALGHPRRPASWCIPETMKDPTHGRGGRARHRAAALRHRDRERLVRASRSPSARRPGARIRRPRPRTSRAARAGCTTPRCSRGSRRR